LQADPDVEVDLVDGPRAVTCRVAVGEDRERLWVRRRELDDKIDAYAGLCPTDTAVAILEPRLTT